MTTTTTLPTGTWTLDQATSITVTATKVGLFRIPAALHLRAGTIEIDADNQVARVEIVADAASYTSKSAKRNEHVRSADFLDADAFPTITFLADAVTETAHGYRADGTVTIKDTTAPLTVTIDDVTVDATTGSFTATATVDRTALGVDKLPTFVIGRDLTLEVSARASLAG